MNQIIKNSEIKDLELLYLEEISKIPLLTLEEEYNYAKNLDDNNIREEFIKRNLRLVVYVAKRYVNRGMEFLDLIQEGNIGLAQAVQKFDITKGYKFSTYATKYISGTIENALALKSRNIRLPREVYSETKKYVAIENRLTKELGRVPEIFEIAEEMDISIEKAENLKYYSLNTVSLSKLVNKENISNGTNEVEEIIIKEDMKENIKKLLHEALLTEEELNMLLLNICNQKSYREIGRMYDRHHSSVNMIVNRALKKVRKVKTIGEYKNYL